MSLELRVRHARSQQCRDPIDEFCTQHLTEYEKRKVKSIAKDDVSLIDQGEADKKKLQKLKEMYKPLTDWWKKFLGN